ncbi:MAG: insulinase family protein [Gemmatimonadaceae bacterium]|nr:insulinase family protein [Gemmatimonadaceae bacterium]
MTGDALQDPALTVGTLPNGLRYYMRVNKAPAHRVEFRLAVNAGSLQEDDDQRGFAHFLEHMAFNGTTHFPHNSLIDFLETSGMRFGADLNAATSYDETVYLMTLPSDDPTILGKGLDALADWAGGGITVDSSEVVAERGVVMGEWRLRDLVDTVTRNYRAHDDSLWFGESRYRVRSPIGDTALLTTAQPGPIRRFYRDWYRPDLMAVVVVGDFDRQQMLREITRRFGAIPAREHLRPRVTPLLPSASEPVVDVYRGPVTPSIEVLWPALPQPATVRAALTQRLVQELLWRHLNERLLAIRQQPSRPFITASTERDRLVRPLNLVGVSLVTWPDSLERGLAAVLTEIQRIAQHGVPKATLEREKTALLRQLEGAATSALARPSAAYAEEYVEHFLTGEGLLLSPQQELVLARTLLPTITPEVLAQAARTLWQTRAGERILVRLPRFSHVRPPTRERILALLDSVERTPLPSEPTQTVAASPLLERLPTPGRIVGERQYQRAGVTEWTLSNGARVLLKSTSNDPDEVLLTAWSPGGFSRMPDSLFLSPGRMVAKLMTEAAGLGQHDRTALQQQLATTGLKPIRVDIGYADEAVDLAGSPKDLETLFQLLYLQFTAPTLDTAAVRSWASLAKYQGNGATLEDEIDQIFARGEPRLWPVSTQLAELVRPEQALAAYKDRFGNAADFTFFLVGALTREQARPLVERYLASLPATGAHETAKPLEVKPFLPKIDNTNRVLELPKAQTLVVFDGPFPAEPAEYLRARQELDLLLTVLQDRVRTRIREELAGDYSPQVLGYTYLLPEAGQSSERYRVLGGFMSAPERMRALWKEFQGILDSLRTNGPRPDELARAATIERRQHETALQENAYWLNALKLYNRLGIPLDQIIAPYGKAPVTPKELQLAAQRYLPNDVYVHVTSMPKDSTLYIRADSVAPPSSSAPRSTLQSIR